jgi:hypothetical protein
MGGGLAGYHQILITGYKAGSQLVRCRNSWGATSPARPDILSDSVAGDFFAPVSFFSNGVVQELVAVMPVGVQPQPQPNPPSPLILSAGGPYSGAIGATLTSCGLLASVSGGTPPYSWRWLIAGYDYSHSNPLVNEATLKREGQYTCVVTCTDSANNSKDASTTFTVTAAPPNPPPPNPPPPQGLTAVHVSATMSDGTTQRWL